MTRHDTTLHSRLKSTDAVLSHPSMLPVVFLATIFVVMGLHGVFSSVAVCPCNYSVAYGVLVLIGPVLPFVLWSLLCCERLCRAKTREKRASSVRAISVMIVAALTWLVMILLDRKVLCCIMSPVTIVPPYCSLRYHAKCGDISTLCGVVVITVGSLGVFISALSPRWMKGERREPSRPPPGEWGLQQQSDMRY